MPSGLDFPEAFKEFNSHFGLAVLAYKLKSTCVVFSDSSSEVKVVHFVRDGQWRPRNRPVPSIDAVTVQIS